MGLVVLSIANSAQDLKERVINLAPEISSDPTSAAIARSSAIDSTGNIVDVQNSIIDRLAHYGTEYGGFVVVPDLLPFGGNALCAGVGEDISFDQSLIDKHSMKVIAIDPTEKAKNYVQKLSLHNFWFLERALVGENAAENITIFANKHTHYVSESVLSSHTGIDERAARTVQTIKLSQLQQVFDRFDLIKLDIEGAEYDLIDQLPALGARTICIEFHHHCTDYTEADTQRAVNTLAAAGYFVISTEGKHEYTFFKLQ